MSQIYWASQSHVTDPGTAVSAIDRLPTDISVLRHAVSQMLLHYRGRSKDVPEGRLPEIHTRYASAMLDLLLSRGEPLLARDREPADRFVGCCRDATVLFLALSRHKKIPARARVGFGSYFRSGWWMDHVVAEVWDGKRWFLVDAQMEEHEGVNWCDLSHEQFITGPQAWKAARTGKIDAEKFVVDPNLEIKELRGWNYLAHHVIHDLVAMGKIEMLLWDAWGMHLSHGAEPVPEPDALILDEVSEVLLDTDIEPHVVEKLARRQEFAVPRVVTRFDPNGGPVRQVDVSKALKGC
jgi:hypothetical protein